MSNSSTGPEERGHDQAQYDNFEPLENAVQDAEDQLEAVEHSVPDRFAPDVEDLEDRLADLREVVDDAQDADDVEQLSTVGATISYLQQAAENLAEQVEDTTASAELDDFVTTMEGVEDRFGSFDVAPTQWFASVNGVPLLYEERTPTQHQLIVDALDPDDASDFTLEAYTSEADTEPDVQFARENQEVDLEDYTVFRTARDKAGGPV